TYDSIYSNGITDDRYFNVNGVQYTQITTSYGNTGMATVTVAPVSANAVPTDMDAYNMAYLSALQSYGLTIDPVTGQIANIAQISQY
ncbi:MAG: hypothetical protein K6F99_02800, partial [Lachnospiraceae bacterium]|nr:hypothetical protein [Lachnospiraceae bacterium]